MAELVSKAFHRDKRKSKLMLEDHQVRGFLRRLKSDAYKKEKAWARGMKRHYRIRLAEIKAELADLT